MSNHSPFLTGWCNLRFMIQRFMIHAYYAITKIIIII